mmetsp:Transcript_20244/g.24955  ORF Transcript_20244/g.24955 Transcript_20244/m.24955 type:complete len:282 (-) Transcript_20244:87-932(-)
MSVWVVFVNACIVAVFQGLGGVPLFIFGELSLKMSSYLTVSASGMMVGTGFLLIQSVLDISLNASILSIYMIYNILSYKLLILGIIFGWLLLYISTLIVRHIPNIKFNSLSGDKAAQAIVVILTMTFHSLGEGASIGVAEGTSDKNLSSNVILSLALHNIPEGLATALYLVGRGMSKSNAILYSILCDIPLPLTAVPAYIFVDTFEKLLDLSIGFAAGAMFYISFVELIPECIQLLNEQIIINKKKSDDKDNNNKYTHSIDQLMLIGIFIASVLFVFAIAD